MKRLEILHELAQAITALEAGDQAGALNTLHALKDALQPKTAKTAAPDPTAYDPADLAVLHAAYGRAMAGTIDAQEVRALIHQLERQPVAQGVALARAFGLTWLPARASRAAAMAAIASKLMGPIEARERATF